MILLFQQDNGLYAKSFGHAVPPLALRLLSLRNKPAPGSTPACLEQYSGTDYPFSKIIARVLAYGSYRAGQLLKARTITPWLHTKPRPNPWAFILNIS